jgi:hypothetical protein
MKPTVENQGFVLTVYICCVQQLEITTDGTYKSAMNIFDKRLLQRSE